MKALDRKVWLPSGGSLVIDRTEAMTVIDVNTGKFVGSGGNLEQTVTRNNLEAAEEIVRQLRLRDVGGIVVIDFIDMVLESNRELVLRRLTECLGRDRTKHQVAEVTSLGLVQMTRKRVGEGLLEAFSETCEVCHGRGVIVHPEPVDKRGGGDRTAGDDDGRGRADEGTRRKRGGASKAADEPEPPVSTSSATKALAAMTAIHRAAHPDDEDDAGDAAELELDAVDRGARRDRGRSRPADRSGRASRPDAEPTTAAEARRTRAGQRAGASAPSTRRPAAARRRCRRPAPPSVADAAPSAPRRPRRRRAASPTGRTAAARHDGGPRPAAREAEAFCLADRAVP